MLQMKSYHAGEVLKNSILKMICLAKFYLSFLFYVLLIIGELIALRLCKSKTEWLSMYMYMHLSYMQLLHILDL